MSNKPVKKQSYKKDLTDYRPLPEPTEEKEQIKPTPRTAAVEYAQHYAGSEGASLQSTEKQGLANRGP